MDMNAAEYIVDQINKANGYADMDETIEKILNQIEILKNEKDYASTYINRLARDEENEWAIVVAMMDYDNEGKYIPYAKLAYQSRNSLMQEYDMDWMMPFMEGWVWDTEVSDPDESDIKWLFDQWDAWLKANNWKVYHHIIIDMNEEDEEVAV